jgi:3-isopropylmalate/(R)-2-methylmalate dehydratase large subunit
VLATQTLPLKPFKTMAVTVVGALPPGVTAKDLVLAVIARIGTGGARATSSSTAARRSAPCPSRGRMTVCNMSIEAGARAGMIAPTTPPSLPARAAARPAGGRLGHRGRLLAHAAQRRRRDVRPRGRHRRAAAQPVRDVGHQPRAGRRARATRARPASYDDDSARAAAERALDYMGLRPARRCARSPSTPCSSGSCTNGRIEDLRAAAEVVRGRKVAPACACSSCPGSVRVRLEAEAEGLDRSSPTPGPSGGTPDARCASA